MIELKRGYDLPKQVRQPGQVPVISSSGPSGYHSYAMARAPGVVTGRYGTLGEVFYITEDYWPLNTTLYVRDFKGNDPRYISYLLKTIDFLSCSDKAAVPGVNRNHLHRIKVIAPPLVEQRAISKILGTLDDKIELTRQTNRTLEEMAQAIFKAWFIDFDGHDDLVESELGPIPRGWRAAPLSDLQAPGRYSLTSGPFGSNLTRKDYVAAGVPVIRGVNLTAEDGWFRDDDFVYVSQEKADDLIANLAYPGDVVFTQRGTLGQVGLIPTDSRFPRYVLSQSQMKLTCDVAKVPPEYVFQYFRQSRTIEYLIGNATQAGVPHVNLGFLRSFPILLPPNNLLSRYGETASLIHANLVARAAENSTLVQLRDALLPRLLSGELRVKDAERLVGEAT
jgi:type I restriction enzyme S subunit